MLTAESRQSLLTVARERITSHLLEREGRYPARTTELEQRAGAFVTLHALHSARRLRGCIGHIAADLPVYDAVYRSAYSAAFGDSRFPPLEAGELGNIELEISVLSPFETIDDAARVVPGTHGVMLELGTHAGLLLPQVASERSWDRSTLLEQLCIKAGVPAGSWRRSDATLSIFTATVFDEASLTM